MLSKIILVFFFISQLYLLPLPADPPHSPLMGDGNNLQGSPSMWSKRVEGQVQNKEATSEMPPVFRKCYFSPKHFLRLHVGIKY